MEKGNEGGNEEGREGVFDFAEFFMEKFSERKVDDYMNYKIHKHGFTWQISPTKNTHENKVTSTMRALCREFEQNYEKKFDDICRTCASVDTNSDNYMNILSELVDGEPTWGRVVAIFAFAGALAVYRLEQGHEKDVDMIREWTCSFMHKHVDDWIAKEGGWKGLVKFYEQLQERRMGGWWSIIVVVIGAVCLEALSVIRR
ncbi:B2CL2-like protein [Mya arenaria]|uniref:B2CL2-like protein n=1 Tax=Mya arenaria TaxID=6604 RepID=A0ABY7DDD8_MYAAR|nr:B2CL2-like protein [Mya arenaria]